MNIIVCVKRVPDLSEADVALDASGRRLRGDDLVYALNDWDRFAIEEALQLKERHDGNVLVISIGDEDAEDVLRRALAMGADEAIRLHDPSFASADGFLAARILYHAIAPRSYDLVITGAVSSDNGGGVVGGMLAAMLEVPQVALATKISIDGGVAIVQHEVEGGLERIVEMDLPAVVSVQTGINEPRYVPIRGIRRVAGIDIPVLDAASLEFAGGEPQVRPLRLFMPEQGTRAEMLQGPTDTVVDQLIEHLKRAGGLQP